MEPTLARHCASGFDVEIVGGSFAGLACAHACAARGLRTLVWERKRDVGASVHTTGLWVPEAAEAWDPPLDASRRIHGVRLYGPSLRWIDLDAPGYAFLATDTPAVLRRLAARALDAGAELAVGRPFDGHRTAPMLVGADGPSSGVARAAGLGRNRRFLAGVEVELEGVADLPERLHVFLDPVLAPGYIGWVVPGVGITQVGLACREPVRPDLDAFLRRARSVLDLSAGRRVGVRGGRIPVGGTVRPFAGRDVVLVGDAAGVVSPLTAGGIHTALASGRAAGIAIASHLLDEGPPPGVALRGTYPSFTVKRWLRRGFDMQLPAAILDRAIDDPRFVALARQVFFHHRGPFSPEGRRDLRRPSLDRAAR